MIFKYLNYFACLFLCFGQLLTYAQNITHCLLLDENETPLDLIKIKITSNGKIENPTTEHGYFQTTLKIDKIEIADDVIEDIAGFAGEVIKGKRENGNDTLKFTLTLDKHKSIAAKGEPVLAITATQLATTGKQTLEEALVYLVPSFYATWQTVADRTRYVTPFSLKGLGPDQVLILINGKRRHTTSVLHINGGFGRGTMGNDLVNINLSSIKVVEILTTAASVKYGSDAIAGVINIRLIDKETTAMPSEVGSQAGFYPSQYSDDDGVPPEAKNKKWWRWNKDEKEGKIGFRWTTALVNPKTVFHIGGDLVHLGSINRSGAYQGDFYKTGDATTANPTKIWANTAPNDSASHRVMEIGRSQIQQAAVHFNFETPLWEKGTFYAFGGFSHKVGRGSGFYRFPKDEEQNDTTIHPDGFLPYLTSVIDDDFITIGATLPTPKMGHLDISYSTGGNSIDYYVDNSVNADLDTAFRTTSFYGGKNFYRQSLAAINWSTPNLFSKKWGLNFESGISMRKEQFGITSGDEASYYAKEGNNKQSGSQMFAGFSKEQELDPFRNNFSAFSKGILTWRGDAISWFVTGGGRYETYTNTDVRFIGKFALSMLWAGWNVHASWNQGFRAASLGQIHYTGLSSQYRGNQATRVFIGNNESNIAKSFGVKGLQPETSNSVNLGIEWKNTYKEHPLKVKADYSYIKLDNRIIISGFFDTTNNISFQNFLKSQEKYNVTSALFFINYLTTETHNVDVTAAYEKGSHHFLLGFNLNKTIIDKKASRESLPIKLRTAESVFFNKEEESRYTEIIPAWKLFLMWNGQCSIQSNFLTWKLQGTLFGNNYYKDPVNENFNQDYENWKTPIIDMEVGYKIKSGIHIALGCNNVFNARSNEIQKPANLSAVEEKAWFENVSYYNLFQYSRRVQTFGVGGAFLYMKASYQIGQKAKKP